MSSSHILYFPVILLVGIGVGYLLGRHATLLQREEDEMARKSRDASDLAAAQDDSLRASRREADR